MGRFTAINGTVLDGVSATTLWTLNNRAAEAKRSDGVLRDPWAITAYDAIDHDWAQFGRPSQVHALRARAFDAATSAQLARKPGASVVALAEGLQTSFWRLDGESLKGSRWYSIDLEPVMDMRAALFPRDDRIVPLAQSALDLSWMDRVDDSRGVVITAEGLLMYLPPDTALGLIRDCAARFPGGTMIFDMIPHWFSRRTLSGLKLSRRYTTPPMPFALHVDEGLALAGRIRGVRASREIPLHAGRGMFGLYASPLVASTVRDRRPLRRTRPSIIMLEFDRDEGCRR